MDCTICVVKTKALISFAVTMKLVCVFVFANVDCWFSDAVAGLLSYLWATWAGSHNILSDNIQNLLVAISLSERHFKYFTTSYMYEF